MIAMYLVPGMCESLFFFTSRNKSAFFFLVLTLVVGFTFLLRK